ncbi:MAG: ribosomal protein S18-alanine N-acetyltransferase [Halioglobus sp.]|nr:ribosomal protein S18-alanine N-acetyltransferase [Halioglobus sp.]
MPPDIRLARADEAAQLAELDAAADSYPWSSVQYSGAVARRAGQQVLVHPAGAEVVACVVLAIAAQEGSIHRIVVGSDQRRQGLGGTLLRAALDRMRAGGAVRCLLEVRESNVPARALYKQAGFSLDGRRKGYYTHPAQTNGREDALLMSLGL